MNENNKSASEKTEKKKSLFNRILEYASTKKSLYTQSIFFAVLGVICSMLPYFFIARIVDKLLAGETMFSAYYFDFVMLAVFWTLRIVFHSMSTARSHVATFAVLGNIRKAICAKLLRVPLGDVKNIPSGTLKNTIVERVDSMETTLAHVVPEFTANIAAPILIFIFLLTINWKMAFASLITFPIGMVCMMGMMKDQETQWANCVEKTKILNDTAVEYINGIEVIKAFGKADSSYERFQVAAREGADCYIDWMRNNTFYFTAAMAITPATMLSVLPIGGIMYLHGTIDISAFVMVIILASGLIAPFITLISYNDDITKAHTIFDEVGALMDMKEMTRPDKTSKEPKDYSIELSDVHFGYGKDKEILHGVSLFMKEGTVNALVGPSGSGKSTVARLVASLWDVDSGSVKVGGVDIRDIALDDYNDRIAYVSQDNYLFNRSVRENIRMGKKGATDDEVVEAAKKCGCHDFIMSLENGYDTVVGDAGGHLSGGERQRISIARAVLKDAPIVILDEATAYTDPENEALIQRSLAKMVQGKTLIVIAHRLSTIMDADKIFVIRNGVVDSEGTHEELLAMDGLYKNMWEAHIVARDNAAIENATMKGGEVYA
ncbi:MAG: ABC transporter ATP-binding protein [Lachnospiraceae bacterium]|nr:ABC transporter ATP-binding protein [Lachnospiraceae bacterium]